MRLQLTLENKDDDDDDDGYDDDDDDNVLPQCGYQEQSKQVKWKTSIKLLSL